MTRLPSTLTYYYRNYGIPFFQPQQHSIYPTIPHKICPLLPHLSPTDPMTFASYHTGRFLPHGKRPQNDPMIQYYIAKRDHPSYNLYLGWPQPCKTTAPHHPKVTPRSHHSHDYTTVLSSIPWTLLYRNHLMPLLAPPHHYPNTTSYFKLSSKQPYKTYYCSVLHQVRAISLTYLPALTTKFRRCTRTRHTCSYHQYRTLTP